MRSTVPIFNKIRTFANPKGNFGKCGPSLWMRSTVLILTRLEFLQTLRKILKKVSPLFEWGLLSQFSTKFEFWKMRALALNKVYCPDFDQIRIFANPKGNFEKCRPLLWMRFIVPIFDKIWIWKMRALALNEVYCPDSNQIRIFANPKGNLEKCGSSLWMRSIVPIFYKIWILENAGLSFEWGLLSWFWPD